MTKIYEFTPLYSIVKRYVTFTFKRFYSEFIVVGRENIPTNGPVIYAPNHTNALMDALAILASVPHAQTVTYLARADIFRNKFAAKLLRFTKIMPAFRMRDGIENLSKNDQTFEKCIEVLDNNHALCIMPEGDQGEQRKLRPFRKGIFRIAFLAQQKYGLEKGLKIVPVGLQLEDFIKFGKHIIISYGKPIEVADYMTLYNENQTLAMNEIRSKLKSDLNNITLNLETKEFYNCYETVIELANQEKIKQLGLDNSTISKFIAKRKIADKLKQTENSHSDKIEKINQTILNLNEKLKKSGINIDYLNIKRSGTLNSTFEIIYLFGTSILFLAGFILNFFPFFTPRFISKKVLKVEYSGFLSSIHYVSGVLTFPIFYTIQTLLIFFILNFPFWSIPFIFIGHYYSGKLAFNWYNQFKTLIKELKYNRLRTKYPDKFNEFESIKNSIINEVI